MYVYGKNVAKELIKNKKEIKNVFLQENFNDEFILENLNKLNVEIKYLSKYEMDKKEDGNHQGIILNIPDFKYTSEKDMLNNISDKAFIVVLDHIEDPHNFGAIIRTCESAKVDYIIIPKDRSVSVNKTVMKTSAGALENVKIVMVTNLNNTVNSLKKKGVWIVGTAFENSVNYDEIDYKDPVAIIIGNEGKGMKDLLKRNCDFIAKIPMYGKINSLNASVAAGILIYEVVRQRK